MRLLQQNMIWHWSDLALFPLLHAQYYLSITVPKDLGNVKIWGGFPPALFQLLSCQSKHIHVLVQNTKLM